MIIIANIRKHENATMISFYIPQQTIKILDQKKGRMGRGEIVSYLIKNMNGNESFLKTIQDKNEEIIKLKKELKTFQVKTANLDIPDHKLPPLKRALLVLVPELRKYGKIGYHVIKHWAGVCKIKPTTLEELLNDYVHKWSDNLEMIDSFIQDRELGYPIHETYK